MPMAYWKFLRLRPPNFPTIRLAQMASMVCSCDKMFSKLQTAKDLDSVRNLFNVEVNGYWNTHFQFEKLSNEKKKKLGTTAVDVLIINAIIPVLFSYGIYHDDQDLKNRSLGFMTVMEPEDNIVIRKFEELGVYARNAQQTQALLHLYSNYCKKRNCLKCRVFMASK